MIRKKIMPLLLVLTLGASCALYGCSNNPDAQRLGDDAKQSAEDAGEDVKEGVENAGEGIKEGAENIKDGAENLWDKVTDRSMEYSKGDFKNDLEKNNVKPEKVDKEGSIFSVKAEYYAISNGQIVGVYEYNSSDEKLMSDDIGTIRNNGMMINGTEVKWDVAAHVYKKGRIIVIYDGNDADTLTLLSNILGAPILG